MEISNFGIDGPVLISPTLFEDERGFFYESFRSDLLNEALDYSVQFVQCNQSYSTKPGTVRGLHYQSPPHQQAKLVSCMAGSVIDIIVDVRLGSSTYGKSIRVELSASNKLSLFVPRGFLHGFATILPNSIVSYMVDGFYNSECDGSVYWDSKGLNLDWGVSSLNPVVSKKDRVAVQFLDWTSPF
jgi:dTDP-4-dehydrorhamnose 3,5-epimerase